jgi:transglutaminase-like putative cysteine protease
MSNIKVLKWQSLIFTHYAMRLLALCCLILSAPALGADGRSSGLTYEQKRFDVKIEKNGSYLVDFTYQIRVNEAANLEEAANRLVTFNRATEEIDILSAETIKANGKHLPVEAAGIREQQAASSANAPEYVDQRRKVILFPDVAVGDRIAYRVRIKRRVPVFAGQFSDYNDPERERIMHSSYIYRVPEGMTLHADARGFKALPVRKEDGYLVYQWDFDGVPIPPNEADAVAYIDTHARMMVTTFASHAELARAFGALLEAAAQPTPEIEAKAREIVDKATATRTKVNLLADWVRNNLRHVSADFNDARSAAPRQASEVLASRYCDARDCVVLLQAMLASQKIKSSPAMVNAGTMYTLSSVAMPDLMGGLLLYVPASDLFIDPSAISPDTGYLPYWLLGKPALLTGSGDIVQTPSQQRDIQRSATTVQVHVDGSADYSMANTFLGANSSIQRGHMRGVNDAAAYVGNLLAQHGLRGSGTLDKGEDNGSGDGYQVKIHAHGKDFASFPGTVGVAIDGNLLAPLANGVNALRQEKQRQRPFVCHAYEVSEQVRYKLDQGVELVSLPQGVHLHDDYFDYRASYERDGADILAKRRLLAHHAARVCRPDDFTRMKPTLDAIALDLRSHLVLRSDQPAPAAAQQADVGSGDITDRDATLEQHRHSVILHADGSSDTDVEARILINQSGGIAKLAQQRFSYNATLESAEVLQAYTLKKDGKRIDVPAEAIVDQAEAASGGPLMLEDRRTGTIVFPQVENGDKLVFHLRIHAREQLYPGQLILTSAPFGILQSEDREVEVAIPEGRVAHADVRGDFIAQPPVTADGYTRYRWIAKPQAYRRHESEAVSYTDYGPRLLISTFDSYAEMAQAFQSRFGDKAQAGSAARALAAKLVAGLKGEREKAAAIHEWVRANIRYVALYVGAGGVVPHSADEVLARRFGDCKDHAVLMEAMLGAGGIASTPALINFGDSFALSKVPAGFNHVITYVPSLDQFFDSTDSATAAGILPVGDSDKDVLLTRSGKIAHTPPDLSQKLVAHIRYRAAADGSAQFKGANVASGSASGRMQYSFEHLATDAKQNIVPEILRERGLHGSGSFSFSQLGKGSASNRLAVEGQLDDFLQPAGIYGVRLSTIFGALEQTVRLRSQELARTQPFVCVAVDARDEAVLELPSGADVLSLPANVDASAAGLHYSATYRREGSSITVQRTLLHRHPGAVCTPEEYAEQLKVFELARHDLKAQVILRSKGS